MEKYSLLRSLKAIDRSDVCVIVLNAEEGIIEHDKHIAGYALEAGKAVVIVVNKWDVIEDKDKKMKEFTNDIRREFQFMPYAPIVYLSALTKKRMHTLMPMIVPPLSAVLYSRSITLGDTTTFTEPDVISETISPLRPEE